MKVLNILGRVLKYLNQDMPLQHETGYDSYWDNRREKASTISCLSSNHRKRLLSEKLIEEDAKVLDIGCGTASLYDAFVRVNKRIDYTRYDMFNSIEDIAKSKNIKLYNKNILEEDNLEVYDYITILNVLEHVHHPEDFILKIKNNFSKSLFISIPNIGSLKNRLRLAVFGKFPITGVYFHVSEHIRFWTVKDFKYWARFYGFEVVAYYGAGNYFKPLIKYFPSIFSENILYELKRIN